MFQLMRFGKQRSPQSRREPKVSRISFIFQRDLAHGGFPDCPGSGGRWRPTLPGGPRPRARGNAPWWGAFPGVRGGRTLVGSVLPHAGFRGSGVLFSSSPFPPFLRLLPFLGVPMLPAFLPFPRHPTRRGFPDFPGSGGGRWGVRNDVERRASYLPGSPVYIILTSSRTPRGVRDDVRMM